jgi:PAS domain S-box-containing protein
MPNPLRVLIVEDSESDALLIARLLGKVGYEVTSHRVETRDDMQAALEQGTWDSVVADHKMPEFDAFAALETLQSSGLDIPFIVASGSIGEETAVALMKSGAADYVMKDNMARLTVVMDRELRDSASRRERRQAIDGLRASEERLREVLGNSRDASYKRNLQANAYEYISPVFTRISGYALGDFEALSLEAVLGLIHPGDLPGVERALAGAMSGVPGAAHQMEYRFRHKEGHYRWLQDGFTVMRDAQGQPAALIGSVSDITEQKQAEETLRESEARLRRLTASTPAYIYEVDREGNILFANNVFQGLTVDQVRGTRYTDSFPQDQRRAVQEALDSCLATGTATEAEFAVPGPTGRIHRFLVQMTPARSADGESTVVITGTDISKLREAEGDRERLMAQLAAEKARWQATVESMLDPVTVSDAQGRAIYMNAAYTRMVNLTIQPDLGLEEHAAHYRLFRTDGRAISSEELPLQRAALTGQEVHDLELVQRDQNGEEHWGVWNAAPLKDDAGRVSGAVAVGHDITEQRRAEAERELLLARLQVEQGRLRAIIDNAPEAILVTDADGRIVLSNPVADGLYGRPVPYGLEFESQAQFTLCQADGTPCPPGRAPLTRSALEGTTTKSAEMVVVWPDGRWRDLLVSTAPIRDPEGQVSGAVGVFQDITELEQAKHDLRRRTAQLETVRQVGLHLSAELELGALLRTIVVQAVALLHVDGGALYLFRPEQDLLEAVVAIGDSSGPTGRLVRRGEGAPGLAWTTGKPSRMAEAVESRSDGALSAGSGGAAVPVHWGDEFLGVIAVSRRAQAPLGEADVEALELVAAQAAIAIRTAWVVAQEAEQRRRAEALTQATTVLASTLDLEELLRRLLSAVMAAIPSADRGAVLLLDETGERLVARTQVGYVSLHVGETMMGRDEHPLLWATLEGQAILVPDVDAGESLFVPLAREVQPPQSTVIAPLRYRGGPIGVVVLTNIDRKAAFHLQDLALLSAFADQAAVAVENARLYEEAQGKAVLEERQRLARALHDSVTQSLYSLTLFTQTAMRRASAGDLERVQENLRQISETAAQSLKDMRLLVYELRRTDLEKIGLVAALQQRLNSVEKRAGVDARLEAVEHLDLPAWAEEALYSIASEAMNNSLKHAAATSLQVSVQLANSTVELRVADNGVGFDPQAARESGGLGLISMRERTEQAGGTLIIETERGKGTTVKVSLPSGPGMGAAGLHDA